MEYIRGTREFQIGEPTAVTLGKFDGLHRGHKKPSKSCSGSAGRDTGQRYLPLRRRRVP